MNWLHRQSAQSGRVPRASYFLPPLLRCGRSLRASRVRDRIMRTNITKGDPPRMQVCLVTALESRCMRPLMPLDGVADEV